MYAIIRTGGKQAKVRPGDVIDVERLKDPGEQVSFVPVLFVDDQGNSISEKSELAGIAVTAKVLGETKGDKIDIFKYKNKTGYRRRMGHRQTYTQIEVLSIDLPEREGSGKKGPEEMPQATKPSPVDSAAEEE